MAIFGRIMISREDYASNNILSTNTQLATNYIISAALVVLLAVTIITNAVVIGHTWRKNNIAALLMNYKAVMDTLYAITLTVKFWVYLLPSADPTQLFTYSIPRLNLVNASYTIYLFRDLTFKDEVLGVLSYLFQGLLVVNSFFLVTTRAVKIKLPFCYISKKKLLISFHVVCLATSIQYIAMSMFYSGTTNSFYVQRILYRFPLFIMMYPKKYRNTLHNEGTDAEDTVYSWKRAYYHYAMDMLLSRSILELFCIVSLAAIIYSIYKLRQLTNSTNRKKMKRSTHHIIILAFFDIIFVAGMVCWFVRFHTILKDMVNLLDANPLQLKLYLCYGPFVLVGFELLIRLINPILYIMMNEECRNKVSLRLSEVRNSLPMH